jgi:glycosyltransferase involved in cell wall biosynthesis
MRIRDSLSGRGTPAPPYRCGMAFTRRRLVFVHSIRFFGSTEEGYLVPLLDGLDPERFEPALVVPDDPVLAPLIAHPAFEGRVVRLPLAPSTSALGRIAATRKALRGLRPDLVHLVDVDPPAAIAARLARVRRLVVTYHTPELRPPDNFPGRILRRLGWLMRPHAIFTSEPDRETGLRLDPIARSRTSVVPLGIDLSAFDPAAARPVLREELGVQGPIVGTVGRLHPQKQQADLVAAAPAVLDTHPDATFVIAGEGVLHEALAEQIAGLGLGERFLLLGQRRDVPDVMASLDVFALTSAFEGLCLVVNEALALGTPVVATPVGGVRQTVLDGETGLLVPVGDVSALAAALVRLLSDRDEARRLGAAGRERVRKLYAQERMVEGTTAVYDRLLA